MSQGYVPGPCQVFTGTGASAAWQFLGYSEDGVDTDLRAVYEPIRSDFGGPAVPVDAQFMGEEGFISMTLNKYNEQILLTLMGRRVGVSVVPGAIEALGLGSLMIAQGYAYKILLLSPYNSLTFQSTIIPCLNFSAGWLHDSVQFPTGVRLRRPRIVFRVVPVWNSSALTASLYTTTLPSPLPSVN